MSETLAPAIVAKLLRYEPDTGHLFWLPRTGEFLPSGTNFAKSVKTFNTRFADKRAFTALNDSGYLHGAIFNQLYRAHRVAWAIAYGEWPDVIDHENGVRDDNRIANLRSVTKQENARNQTLRASNISGKIGVTWFAWAEARIKALTGGDPITARFMRQDFFTYQPQFKLLFAGNHQPTLTAVDDAMKRRFNMLPFIHKPATPDHMLEATLRDEAPRILAWAIRGCLDWQKHGLGRPKSVEAATEEYFNDQDVFGEWVAEKCTLGPREWDQPTPLFKSWVDYAKAAGEDPGTAVSFSSRLKKLGLQRGKVARIRAYLGISLLKASHPDA